MHLGLLCVFRAQHSQSLAVRLLSGVKLVTEYVSSAQQKTQTRSITARIHLHTHIIMENCLQVADSHSYPSLFTSDPNDTTPSI